MADSPTKRRHSAATEAIILAAASPRAAGASDAAWPAGSLESVFSFQRLSPGAAPPPSPPQVGGAAQSALRWLVDADAAAPLSPPPLRAQPRLWAEATPPGGLPPPRVRHEGARSPIRWRTPPPPPPTASPRRGTRDAALPAERNAADATSAAAASSALALTEETAAARLASRRDADAAAAARSGVARLVADLEAQRWVRPCHAARAAAARRMRRLRLIRACTLQSFQSLGLISDASSPPCARAGGEPRARGGHRAARRRGSAA